ncbi:MAG: hypothetical protein ACKO2P_14670 [Planctomycetota bacterium]
MLTGIRRFWNIAARRHLCPWCFEWISLRHPLFRCGNPQCTNRAPDPVLEREWKDSRPVTVPFYGRPFSSRTRCRQPNCRRLTTHRICPNCHQNLPQTLGDCRGMIFAVIGAKGAGKSHYIGVLLHQLLGRVGLQQKLIVTAADDGVTKRFQTDYERPLYQQRVSLPETQARKTQPLVYVIRERPEGHQRFNWALNAVFFDTAGENLGSRDAMEEKTRYIGFSEGVILLLDPLQIPAVRDAISRRRPGLKLPDRSADADEILTRTATLIREQHGQSSESTELINTPLAVAFTKWDPDGVQPLLHPDSLSLQPAGTCRGYDQADGSAIHDEIESLLKSWGCDRLLQQTQQFRTYRFFGLSALGEAPVNGRIHQPNPLRESDPFLWLLFQHRYLKPVQTS